MPQLLGPGDGFGVIGHGGWGGRGGRGGEGEPKEAPSKAILRILWMVARSVRTTLKPWLKPSSVMQPLQKEPPQRP